jgi:hypothetical protein
MKRPFPIRIRKSGLIIVFLGLILTTNVSGFHFSQTITSLVTAVQLATSPALPDVIFANLKFGDSWLPPRLSVTGGHLWQEIRNEPGNHSDYYLPRWDVAITPRSDTQNLIRLLVASSGTDAIPAEMFEEHFGIFRSGDVGQTWGFLNAPFHSGLACVWQWTVDYSHFNISPANPHFVSLDYSILEKTDWCYPPGPAPKRNDDIWNFVYTGSEISMDDGITWVAHEQIQAIVPSPVIADRLYGFDTDHFVQSDDGGTIWTPKIFPIETLVPDAKNADLLYGYLGSIGLTSTDNGNIWKAWNEQPCPDDLLQLVAHPTQTGGIFLRCNRGLFYSSTAGETWSQLSGTSGQLLAPDYGNPGRLLWARDDGLWASNDSGSTWEFLSSGYEDRKIFLPLVP